MTRPIVPVLQPASWERLAEHVHQPLLSEPEGAELPVVACAYDHPESYEFVQRTSVEELQTTEEELLDRARRSIRDREATWAPMEVPGESLEMLVCEGPAEKVLDPAFMQDAQRRLDTDLLVVGVPTRGLLLVADGRADEETIAKFAAGVDGQYQRAEAPPVSPTVMAFRDGEPVGALVREGEGGAGEPQGDDAGGGDDEPYVQSVVMRDSETGGTRVEIYIGTDDAEQLTQAVKGNIEDAVERHGRDEAFGGLVRVLLVPELTPRTGEMEAVVDLLRSRVDDSLTRSKPTTVSGHPIRVEIDWGAEAA